jgi:beta-glucosidase
MKKRRIIIATMMACSIQAMAQQLPYQNHNLPAEQRADDLLKRLTLEEKASLMMNSSPAIPRLGIPEWDWWSEALHGIGRNGLCTVFPSCIGMACSFNDALIERIFSAVSDEGRAKNTLQRKNGTAGKYQCLSFWTPTINIFRDPRWGRGQESYGEDPFMNGQMGLAVVRGLQGGEGHKYYKLLACAKHFAVHSGPEKTRHHFDINNLPARDLWETYLPAFKTLVQQGNVQEVMCAYQRFEGAPCCGSNRLLQQILRDEWGFKGLVVSDCGAIGDFWREGRHMTSPDAISASADAVISGTDVECGGNYKHLPRAVKDGNISEAQIDISVKRLLKGRFELGNFDADELVEWTKIPASVIASKEHKQLALEMGREQMVLLQNKNSILPLKKDAGKIMVMGPNAADSTMLWGIYYGQPSHTVTILEGIESKIGKTRYSKTCEITAMTESQSIFNLITNAEGQPGMKAQYWNNMEMMGMPVVETNYTSPIKLDNGGNTAFAPGVELTNFTTRMKGSFVADKTETLDIYYNNDDGFRLIINGDTLTERWKANPMNFRQHKLKVVQGKRYDVELNYMQIDGDAALNFDITRNQQVSTREIVERAKDAETIIFVGGISPALEREEARITEPGFDNGDRTSIELPQVQRDILKALHEAGKKVVLVNCSGSAVALTPETETCDAILQAWYAGEQGGHAVADVLFGDYNPSGKLAVTFYKDDSQLPPFDEYRMEGRTYRYFKGEALYPFGYGLSYTTFGLGRPTYDKKQGKVMVKVSNTGNMAGTEVVQVYIRNTADIEGPLKTLRAYKRVMLQPGESRQISIDLPRDRFEGWDVNTNTMRVVSGKYEVMVGTSSSEKDLKKITVKL